MQLARIAVSPRPLERLATGVATLFLFQNENTRRRQVQSLPAELRKRVSSVLALKDYGAKEGEIIQLYTDGQMLAPRLLLVGLGESRAVTLERLRRAAAAAARKAQVLKSGTAAFDVPPLAYFPRHLRNDAVAVAQAIAEGALLGLYRFDKYLSKSNHRIRSIVFSVPEPERRTAAAQGLRAASVLGEAVYHARDLENAPANEIFPESLAREARRSGRRCGFRVRVLGKTQLERLAMGGVLAVGRGSHRTPQFIILEYRGARSRSTVVLVGKGVTFDSGGISLKSAAGMAEMKMDMSGAAAVIGAFEAIARLKLPVHLVGLIPAVENMPGGGALKPGDIIRHHGGKTSEVDNTDAEGRLILADALEYASRYKPDLVIDLATLTGACVVALGHHATGMMGNDQPTMDSLASAGETVYERLWQLPLYDEYEKLIKSDVADVKNVGGRWAGAITAAWFLKKFVGKYRWIHLDIAGTAILEETQDYAVKGGTGIGVRLLAEFLKRGAPPKRAGRS